MIDAAPITSPSGFKLAGCVALAVDGAFDAVIDGYRAELNEQPGAQGFAETSTVSAGGGGRTESTTFKFSAPISRPEGQSIPNAADQVVFVDSGLSEKINFANCQDHLTLKGGSGSTTIVIWYVPAKGEFSIP